MSTRAQLLAEVTTSFPNNTTGAITPAILSTQQNDVINSCWIPATDGTPLTSATGTAGITGTAGQVLANGGTSQQFGAVTLTLASALTGINSVTSAAATDHTINAGAGNQNVVLSPSGTGFVRAGATVTTETAGTVAWQFTGTINNFYQGILQNTSNGASASTDLVLYNDQVSGANPTTHYLDLGKNSSGFSGAGPINIANGSYLYEQTDSLSIGTVASQTLHLFTNNTDQLTISGAGVVTFTGGATFAGALVGVSSVTAPASTDLALNAGSGNQSVVANPAGTGGLKVVHATDAYLQMVLGSTNVFVFDTSSTTVANFIAQQASSVIDFYAGGSNPGNRVTRFTSTGHVLLGGLTTDGTGVLQFPAATTTAGGITFGTDVNFFRNAAGAQTLVGTLTMTPAARASGVANYFTVNIPADTGITAATESIGFQTVTGTRTWATTGTVALQRENYFAGPTYASAGASQTFTDAFTMYLDKPIAGTNAIFTRGHTLGIVDSTSAASSITGAFIVATTLGTSATSVGIGGGNINAGGLITGGTVTSSGLLTSGSHTLTGAAGTTALTIAQTARTSGVLPYIKWTIPTDTAQTASTESPGVQVVTGTRTWATTGTVALQREIFFAGPTYASASASQTFTDAFNVYITPPVAGSNAIFTRGHSLGIVDATSATTAITGGFVLATTLGTAATSIGMGGGNIVAGGNIFASTSTGRIGYLAGSGAGGAVTQLTSRVTGVTLNTPTGQITLFAAAGSATAATFTVTCSAVAATDTIYLSQVSGTNLYETFVTAVGAGSFNITFFTTGGTASDSPVFNYTVVKGSAS